MMDRPAFLDSLKNFPWLPVVAAVAPALAQALGGPLAGLAVRQISEALLGKQDGSSRDIGRAISDATHEDMIKLKQADQAFAARMRELDVDLEKIAAEDRASARTREVASNDSWTIRALALLAIGGFLAVVFLVLSGKVEGLSDPLSATIIGAIIGYVSAKADQVISYYFGSSAGSARKTEALADALKGKAQ